MSDTTHERPETAIVEEYRLRGGSVMAFTQVPDGINTWILTFTDPEGKVTRQQVVFTQEGQNVRARINDQIFHFSRSRYTVRLSLPDLFRRHLLQVVRMVSDNLVAGCIFDTLFPDES